MKKILIVDDDIYISNMLSDRLEQEGFQIYTAFSGTETLLFLSSHTPDLILLDLMLPGLSGEEVLPQIQDIPVIVVSAKTEVIGKVKLLLDGAADYITKPFDIEELVARIIVQLRHNNNNCKMNVLTFDDISLDTDNHTVMVANKPVKLTRTEYAILKLFLQNKKQVITKTQILNLISEDTPDCTENTLKVHIRGYLKTKKHQTSCTKRKTEVE